MPGLEQPVDALLPPGAVQLAGQVVPGVVRAGEYFHTGEDSLKDTDLTFSLEQFGEQ